MTFSEAIEGVKPFDRIALYNDTGARIVNFNNPVASKSKKTAAQQIKTITGIVETLPPGRYSVAGKAPGTGVEPVLFPFDIEGAAAEAVEVIQPTYAQSISDVGGSDLYKKVEDLQRQLLEAKLSSQEANMRAEMLLRRNEELIQELEDMESAEPMAEAPSLFEQILTHAAPAIMNHLTNNLGDGPQIEVPGEAIINAQQGQQLLQERQAQGLDCNNVIGRERAQQLVDGEELSQEDLQQFKSYLNRARTYYDQDQKDCGTISYLLWGGDAMRDYLNAL